MSEKLKGLSPEEARLQRVAVLRELADLLGEIAGGGVPMTGAHHREKIEPSVYNAIYARAPLGDAIVEYLGTCKKPQTAKQILAVLRAAGREFESDNPVGSIQWALKKTLVKNEDLFHIRYGQWHLRSKYPRKAVLEKLLAKNASFGRGGRSSTEHIKRTKKGMDAARASGKQIGAATKMTPEKIEEAKEMLRAGMSAREVAKHLGVAVSSMYGHGLSPRKFRRGDEPLHLRLVK